MEISVNVEKKSTENANVIEGRQKDLLCLGGTSIEFSLPK